MSADIRKQLENSEDKRLILSLRDGEVMEADILSVYLDEGEIVCELAYSNRLEKYPKGRASTYVVKIADIRSIEEKKKNV
jgi:hypothetical protein